jgi:hypothetical protein
MKPYQNGMKPYQNGMKPYQNGMKPYQNGMKQHVTIPIWYDFIPFRYETACKYTGLVWLKLIFDFFNIL